MKNTPLKKAASILLAAAMIAGIALAAASCQSGAARAGGDPWSRDNFAARAPSFQPGQPHGAPALSLTRFMSDNLRYRIAFSYRERDAAAWIVEELLAIGFDWQDIRVQEFAYADVSWFCPFGFGWAEAEQWSRQGGIPLRQDRMSQNVIVTIPGQSERFIVAGAHYDSYLSAGASDNASGVALLLESAYRMRGADNYHTIVYAFFGAEELGLWGARYFHDSLSPRELDNLVMMVNADGVIDGPYLMYAAAAGSGPGFEFLPNFIEVVAATAAAQIEAMLAQIGFEALLGAMGMAGMGIESPEQLIEIVVAQNSAVPPVAVFSMWEPAPTPASAQIDGIASALSAQNDFELLAIPRGIVYPTDQMVFLLEGHMVVVLAGLARVPGQDNMEFLMARDNGLVSHFLHTASDEFSYIEAFSPGMMGRNLRAFSLLLEGILLEKFD